MARTELPRGGAESGVSGRKGRGGSSGPAEPQRAAPGRVTRRAAGEGSIRQRADNRYEVRVRLPDGTRRSLYARTLAEAVEQKNKLIAKTTAGLTPPSDRVTLSAYLDGWVEGTNSGHVRANTAKNYAIWVGVIGRSSIGRERLARLTAGQVERMAGELLRAGYSPRSVNQGLKILRIALGQAVRDRVLDYNAAQHARPLPVPRQRRMPMRREDALAIIAAVRDWYYGPAVLLALSTGMRRGEICGLRWGDIDFDACLVHVRQQIIRINGVLSVEPVKTGTSERTIPVHPLVLEHLQAWRTAALPTPRIGPYADLIFTSTRHPGVAVDPAGLVQTFQKRAQRAGLGHLKFHDLRHAAISFWHALGVDPKTAAELAGHSHVAMTLDVYTHVAPETQRNAALKLGELLLGAGGTLGVSNGENGDAAGDLMTRADSESGQV